MKKSLLIVLAVGSCLLANAQSGKIQRANTIQPPSYNSPAAENPLKVSPQNSTKKAVRSNVNRTSNTQTFSKIKFSTSHNLFSTLVCTVTQVTYNQDLNLIA